MMCGPIKAEKLGKVIPHLSQHWTSFRKFCFNCLQGKEHILEKARQISRLQRDVGMQVDSEYEDTFKFNLMEVVFEWARGLVSYT